MATRSSILVWEMPWTEGPVSPQPMGRRTLDTTERLSTHTHTHTHTHTRCWAYSSAPGSFSFIPAKAVTTAAIAFSMIFHNF